jgi:hypothetical protein
MMNRFRDDLGHTERPKDETMNNDGTSDLPEAVQEAVNRELKSGGRLQELGFTQDKFGQWRAENCTVTVYSSCGEYEIDILMPNGSAVGCDTPKFAGRTRDEIERDQPPAPAE